MRPSFIQWAIDKPANLNWKKSRYSTPKFELASVRDKIVQAIKTSPRAF